MNPRAWHKRAAIDHFASWFKDLLPG